MREIKLIRHAKQQNRSPGARLTEHGRRQAAQTGEALRARGGMLVLHTSPAPRAKETAEIIAEHAGADSITQHDILGEVVTKPPGVTDEEHVAEWKSVLQRRDFTPLNGRSMVNTAADVRGLMTTFALSKEAPLGNTQNLVVAHAGTFAAFLGDNRYFPEIPDPIQRLPETLLEGLDEAIPNCSITTIDMDPGEFYVVRELGATGHLDQQGIS